MKQNKVPKNEYIRKPVGKTNPYKHDVDYVSRMGYRDDSPFNDRPYIDIHTPSGMIDMSNTGIPLMANGMYLPPYSGTYNMGTPYVREQKIPMASYGGDPSLPNIEGHYQDGGAQTPEEWEKEIRAVENKIGDPSTWTLDSYKTLQDKLNEYKAWRENTPEGKAVIDYHNEPNEYIIPLPSHLQTVPKKPFGGIHTKTHTHMKEGGWLDQYQTKGEVKPIYVTDPNDPRLRAYNDSLIMSDLELRRKGDIERNNKISNDISNKVEKAWERLTILNGKSPQPIGITKGHFYIGTDNLGKDIYTDASEEYKKPVQPYKYAKPKPKLKPKEVITPDYLPMIQTGMPDMISREPEIIASPTPRPSSTNNRISWRMDPETRKMVPVYLEGKTQKVKEGKRLYNKNIPSSTAAIPADFVPQFEPDGNKDVVSKQMGGWLDKYQDGGWDENFQRPGPVADNVAPVISTPFTPKISQEFLQQNVKPYSYNPLPIRTFEDFKGKRSTLGADYNDYLDYKKYIDQYKKSNLPEILQDAEDSYQGRGKWEDSVRSNDFIQDPKLSNWLKLSHLEESHVNKTRENQYYIPSGKQIKLTQGRYNLGKIDTGLVDEIVKKAKQYGVDPLDILAIAGRESTFAQPYGKKSKRESNDLTDIFSAWANSKENASRYKDYFGKKKHPGLSLVKDKSGWRYGEDRIDGKSLAKYSQEDVDEYLKYLQEKEKTGPKDNALDFVAKMIKDKKLHKYNPGDPDYQNKLANEKKLLSQEKELMKYLGSNNEESLTTKKMGGWLDKYQGDISGSQVMPSETTQSFIPANLKNKLDQLKKQDPKYKQKLAQEKKFYDDVAKAEEDARKKEIADRKARIANSIKAQDEKIIGNPNWREVLARQTQATGDKLRISDEPNFFDDYVNPAAMIGSMATGLGQAPYQAQQQDSYMPYLTGIGMPLAMGALAGLGAKSTGQFINNIVNPLAGLEQSLLNRGKGVVSKEPGFLTTQQELAMMNADDLPSGVSTPAQGSQLPPPPSKIIISPSGESRTVWQQIPIPVDPPMPSLLQKDLSAMRNRLIQRMERPRNYSSPQFYNDITTGDPDLSSFVSRTVLEAPQEVKTKIKNISGLTQEDALAIAAGKDKDKIAKMSETEFENTVLNPNGEIITYKKGPEVNNITYDMNTGRMVLRDQNIIPEEEYVNMFNANLDRLNEIIAKKNKSGVQYRVKGLNREGHLTFETPEQLIPRQRTQAALDNYNAFQEYPEIWAEERAGLRQNEDGTWRFNDEVGMDAYSTKEGAMKALSEAVEDQLGPMQKISGESVWGVNMNPGKWQGDVQDIANKEYYRAIPGLEMSNTTGSVFADKTARRGSKAYEAINDYLKEMGMGRVKPGFNSQTLFSKGAWEDFVKKGKAFGYYGDPKTVYGSMRSMLPYLGLGYLGYEGMQDDGYRRGGSLYTPQNLKKKTKSKGTSKNIQSSINSLFARNFDLYGSSNKAMYNPNSKYKEGGWLDEYQTRGEVLPQSVLAKPAITKEEDSKYDIYKQVIPKPQLTLEKKREFTPEEQAYSNKVKARIANPAADIGILAGNMASALSRGQYLTPEEIASVTNNPMKALGLSSEMTTFALANEMVGPLLQKAITSIPRGAAVLGQLSKKSKYGTPRPAVVNDAIDYTFAQPPVEPVFTETIIDPLPQNTIVSNNIKPGQNKALDEIEAITDWDKWEKKYKGKNIAKKGHFNRGVFEIKGHPEFLAKIEEPGAFDSDMELVGKDYINLDFPTLHSEITSPNIGKVIKQLPHPSNPNQRILIMKKVEGKGIRDLTANQLKKIPDEAFIQLDADLRDLRNKGLATDFVGDNILYNNKDKSFKIIDLSPTKTTMGPSMQDFWLENVIKGVDQSLPKEESAKKIREAVKDYFRETYRTGIDNVIQPPYYIRKKLTSEDPHIFDRGNKLLEEYQQRTSPERIKNYRIKALNELRNKYSKVFNMLDEQPVQRFGGGWLDNLD